MQVTQQLRAHSGKQTTLDAGLPVAPLAWMLRIDPGDSAHHCVFSIRSIGICLYEW